MASNGAAERRDTCVCVFVVKTSSAPTQGGTNHRDTRALKRGNPGCLGDAEGVVAGMHSGASWNVRCLRRLGHHRKASYIAKPWVSMFVEACGQCLTGTAAVADSSEELYDSA